MLMHEEVRKLVRHRYLSATDVENDEIQGCRGLIMMRVLDEACFISFHSQLAKLMVFEVD